MTQKQREDSFVGKTYHNLKNILEHQQNKRKVLQRVFGIYPNPFFNDSISVIWPRFGDEAARFFADRGEVVAPEQSCSLITKTRLYNTNCIIEKGTWIDPESSEELSVYFVGVQE